MADQRERVDMSNTGGNNERNTNASVPNYSNNQAWAQYWQYYYSYYMYYYTSYYYMALCQNSAGFVNGPSTVNIQPTTAQLNGARVHPNNQPDLQQRLLHGNVFGVVRLGQRVEPEERYEYKIAPLGRRVFAEFIDFVFLYFLKYSLFLLYYKDPDKLNSQFQYILVIDDNTSFKDLEDVLVQALIYRFIVFLYEEACKLVFAMNDKRALSTKSCYAFFLSLSFPCNTGGATLGKYMMGITVVLYPSLTPIEGQNLRRFTGNAQRLSLWQSCVRATLKNFMITFFFPIIFTTMFLQNFRTPYDFLASSVVVDANRKRLPPQN